MRKITITKFITISFLLIINFLNAQSTYEEAVTLPTYDANNSEMFIIDSNADWSHINDSDKKYFFVVPGDYSENVTLTASGTENNKRYIVLYNGNNTHPGKLNQSQLVKIRLELQNANYWVIDRMGYWNNHFWGTKAMTIKNSDNNIINRYYMHDIASGIFLHNGSDNNTIQNCRVDRDDISLWDDQPAIALINENVSSIVSIKNTKIVNNEVRNFVDAVQTVRIGNFKYDSYEGTIIDNNHFYIDNTIYTDGNGNHDPNGNFAYAENPIDLKIGSENPNNPIIISNNKMWGYRQADQTGSSLNDWGAIMPIHNNVNHTIIRDNVCFDSTRGFAINAPANGYSGRNLLIENNIFYDIKEYIYVLGDTDNIIFHNNLQKNIAGESNYWISFLGATNNNLEFSKNITINSHSTSVNSGPLSSTSSNNEYFQSLPGQIADASDVIHTTDPTLNYDDFVFITDRYTNNPRTITIPKVIKPNTQNNPPTATNVIITGTPGVGGTLTLNYDFSDPDGDAEGASIIVWSTPTLELQRGTSTIFVIPEGFCGDTFGAWVHPVDSQGLEASIGYAASNNMLDITCDTASIDSNSLNTRAIYPNPATNTLTIIQNQVELKNYTIVSILGKKVASGNLMNSTIDISKLDIGVYFLKLNNNNQSITLKFIKQYED